MMMMTEAIIFTVIFVTIGATIPFVVEKMIG